MGKVLELAADSVKKGMLIMIDAWANGGEGLTEEPLRIMAVDWPVIRVRRYPPVPISERDLLLRLLDPDGESLLTLSHISEDMLAGVWKAADDITGMA